MTRIWPGKLVETLDGDPTFGVVVELSFVDNVGGFLAVLGDYVVGGEAARGGFQLVEAELGEARARVLVAFVAPILCKQQRTQSKRCSFLFGRKKTEQKGWSFKW